MADLIIKVGGEGGTDSPTTAGEFITLAAIRQGNEVFTLRTLPAEIKGGLATFQVRMSDQRVMSQGDRPDVLCCLNQEAYDKLLDDLAPDGGVLIYDPDAVQLQAPEDSPNGHADRQADGEGRSHYAVPMTRIASNEVKERRTKNMVALGAIAQLFGLPLDTFKQLVADKYGKRGEAVVGPNHAALDAGFAYAAEHLPKRDPYQFTPNPDNFGRKRMVVDGSDAIGMGAALAGCDVYAGYPITPASEIMHWLARYLPRFGGTVMQTEDEIAALAACLGASFTGAKSMTATSGPGLSLMVELLGLGSMAELPVVIVDAQRGGPSTGLPTKCESGDLNLAVYGAHGDASRIVLAPANIRDCLLDTAEAFNLAEKYQTPVIVLSDQSMAMRTQALEPPDPDGFQRVRRKLFETEQEPTTHDGLSGAESFSGVTRSDYKRYELTEDGVSAVALPGQPGTYYTITGLSHDEHANPATNNGALSAAMMEKRQRKIDAARHEPGWSRQHGPDQARWGVISWGSLEGAVNEAIDRINGDDADGQVVRGLHLRMMAPLPVEALLAFADTVEQVVVCELNFSGQLNRIIRAETDLRTRLINKYDGIPFTPGEIVEALHALMQDARQAVHVHSAPPLRDASKPPTPEAEADEQPTVKPNQPNQADTEEEIAHV